MGAVVGSILSEKLFSVKRLLCCVALLSVVLLSACEKKRPPGYLNIGKVSEIASQSVFLQDKQIFLHRDQRGVSVMSTLCSYDLSPLRLIVENGREVLVSDYSASRYDVQGNVLAGPAERPLPYYSARLDSGVYGGPLDTIYVQIGTEVDRGWRLVLP